MRLCFSEHGTIVIVDPQIQRVVSDHAEHRAVMEDTRLAEHAPERDGAERRELLAQEFDIVRRRNHAGASALIGGMLVRTPSYHMPDPDIRLDIDGVIMRD